MPQLPADQNPANVGHSTFLRGWTRHRLGKLVIVLVGIIVGQVILYGPSLAGRKILLPLDILANPTVYIPVTPGAENIVLQDAYLSDLVYAFEPERRFAVSELHAGRLPSWTTYEFAGSPFVWPMYSPFMLLECLTASPVIIAWAQLMAALVAGLGAYLFFRRVLGVSFWSAAIPAWCYPLTGFFVFWQGYPISTPVYWLPWILLAVDRAVRRPDAVAAAGLSLATCLVLVSGQVDIAGLVLLVSGLFALWCLVDSVRRRQRLDLLAGKAVLLLVVGWGLGFLLASPFVLPLIDYAHTGSRMERRFAGSEERPPIGLAAIPQVVVPDIYGSSQGDSLPMFPEGEGNQLESSSAAYAGVIATLLLTPLAWCSRRHRSINLFWTALGFFALSWCFNVPGFVEFLRTPGLNMLSYNRLVFAASFAILAMAAIGLEVLREGGAGRQWWFWLPALLLAGLCVWCADSAMVVPQRLAAQLEAIIQQGKSVWMVHDLAGIHRVQSWFARAYTAQAVFFGLGAIGWLFVWLDLKRRAWLVPVVGMFLLADLLWFARGRSPQCDPALYYPRVPALEEIAKSPPGRIMGNSCLPPDLAQAHGLSDVRGYDAVDPARFMKLMAIAADPDHQKMILHHALTQWLVPSAEMLPPDGIRLSPVLDMLGVRYVIYRGTPPETIHPFIQKPDYWVLVNRAALPRAFVPRRVETVADDGERLEKLRSPQFDPREVAYVESPVSTPSECRGTAAIVAEVPTRVTVSVQMETPGMVVLADLWDKGWRAYLDGRPVPILRANHAVRGVVVPAGAATVEFRYQPASLVLGLRLAGLAVAALLAWLATAVWIRRRAAAVPALHQDGDRALTGG